MLNCHIIYVIKQRVKPSKAQRPLAVLGETLLRQTLHHQYRRQGNSSLTQAELQDIEAEFRKLFEKYGTVANIVAKRNRNSEYCFAFIDMKDRASAEECVKA